MMYCFAKNPCMRHGELTGALSCSMQWSYSIHIHSVVANCLLSHLMGECLFIHSQFGPLTFFGKLIIAGHMVIEIFKMIVASFKRGYFIFIGTQTHEECC